MWPRSLALGLIAVAITAGVAVAQRRDKSGNDNRAPKGERDKGSDEEEDDDGDDDDGSGGEAALDGKPPPGFEFIEVQDLTFTMRDEAFNALAVDPVDPNIAYVGSHQGHVYKTTDRGRTWTESVVITQMPSLWQTGEGSVFTGGVRSAGAGVSRVDLLGGRGDPLGTRVPTGLGRLPFSDPGTPLDDESAISAGGTSGSLGLGISQRAPRLSLLAASKGRPVPTLNRFRLIFEKAGRGTSIYNITIDPNDRNRLFAATVQGLYRSDDGGQTWSRTFVGLTAGERVAYRIAIRPGQPSLMLLGTAAGLYISTDGRGDGWAKSATVGSNVQDVAFDKDGKHIYLATYGSVMRSDDGGRSFIPIYFSTFPADAAVQAIVIDPYDDQTVYIGTGRGTYVTHNARAQSVEWKQLPGPQSALTVPILRACPRHKGHIYAMTKLDLHTINYGGANPESTILETWDGGKTWRELFGGVTGGSAEAIAMDANDPDQLWIAWTIGIHRLERRPANAAMEVPNRRTRSEDDLEEWPTLSQVIDAMMHYQGLDLIDYQEKLDGHRRRNFVPRTLTVTGVWRNWSMGGVHDDAQFTSDRYFQIGDAREWQVMAFASWNLPDLMFTAESVAMLRQRLQVMNDELRRRLVGTVRHGYAEMQRLRGMLASVPLDTKTQVIYRVRIEQLEAVVDLTSGGYLTRWKKKRRRSE